MAWSFVSNGMPSPPASGLNSGRQPDERRRARGRGGGVRGGGKGADGRRRGDAGRGGAKTRVGSVVVRGVRSEDLADASTSSRETRRYPLARAEIGAYRPGG